ncbi:MAG: DNA-protecting protein DprA [Magnetococcales bacterium]|nr:DNA-protecting protein DprA [Magnetococcales bacterium]MBF0438094.1 DNA-protecting protein DprA [Magnetococcales bacterium]
MEHDLLIDWLRLIRSPSMGAVTLGHLIRHLGHPSAVLTATRKTLSTIPRLSFATVNTLEQFRHRIPVAPIARELQRLQDMGGRVLALGEADYPPMLATLYDPPPALFILGDPAVLTGGGPVTVTGTRKATRNGVEFATRLGRDLAQSGIVTVSGLAIGIDTAAHLGALDGGGLAVAVLATGLDQFYPRANRELQQQIAHKGCVVTEAPLGLLAVPWLLPARSRILAGLSRGVVIVEAPEKSGALITARMALEQGREVFAVPGSPNDPTTRGTHELLRQGARLTEGVADILEELQWPLRPPLALSVDPKPSIHPLPGEAATILARIEAGAVQEDELARCCQVSVAELSCILLQLELSGLVERRPGGQYAAFRQTY